MADQQARNSCKIFLSPWKNVLGIVQNYWTYFKKFGPLSENSSLFLVSQAAYGPSDQCMG